MSIILRTSALFIAISMTSAMVAQSFAQATKVSPDEVMDSAFDMKKAAEKADKLAPDGSKYCRWSIAPLDASDLEAAISRFLLNHGSRVPEEFLASKMWRVSFVAEDLTNQLEMGLQECNAKLRFSDNAGSVADAAKPVLFKLMDVMRKFNLLAYQQTVWQSRNNEKPENIAKQFGSTRVDTSEIITAVREIKEAWEGARKAMAEAHTTKGCFYSSFPNKPLDLTELDKLLDYMTRAPQSANYTPAANIWLVVIEAETTKLEIATTLESCVYFAAEKKKAEKVATEALGVYHRLKAAIRKLDLLALQQTEWGRANGPETSCHSGTLE